jgi:hypothetical protein
MLANRDVHSRGFGDVDQHLRHQAHYRDGVASIEYEIGWKEHSDSGIWLMDIFRKWIGYDATHFSVRFTGEELRSLDRAVLPKLQEASTLSARTCQVLVSHVYNIWDTDSGDHLAMRRAGLQAYLRYASCQRCYENKRWVHLLGAAAMLIGLKRRWPANVLVGIACTWLLHGAPRTTIPTLQRIKGVQPVRAEPEDPTPEAGTEGTDDGSDNGRTGGVAEGAGDDVQGAPGSNLDTILPGRDQTRDPNQELGLHRGEPTDRQLAGESGNSRVWLNNGVIGIRGQSFTREGDTFTQCPTDQINGLVVGPLAVEPNVFSMTKECVDHAYQERVEKKQRIPGQDGVPDVRADIKASIGAIVPLPCPILSTISNGLFFRLRRSETGLQATSGTRTLSRKSGQKREWSMR